MDDICLPVRYDQVTEAGLQEHMRHCASHLSDGDTVEVLLCEAGVVIPIIKREHRTKSSTLDVLARSGSINRNCLSKLRTRLLSEGYDPKISFTSKRKLLKRIVVSIPVADALLPVNVIGVLRSIAGELNSPWPCTLTVAYAVGSERHGLPGRLTYRTPAFNVGYYIGRTIGKLVRKLIL